MAAQRRKRKGPSLLRDGIWTTTNRLEAKGRVRPKPSKYQNFDGQYMPKGKFTVV
jgi:hypothetical protein